MKKIILLFLFLTFVSISLAQDRVFRIRALVEESIPHHKESYTDIVTISFYKDKITIKDTYIKQLDYSYDTRNATFRIPHKTNEHYAFDILTESSFFVVEKKNNKMTISPFECGYNIVVLEAREIDPKTKKPISDKISKDDLMKIFRQLLESYHTEKPKSSSASSNITASDISEFAESYLKGYYKQQNLVFEFDENNELKKETDCVVAWWGTELQLSFFFLNLGLNFSFSAADTPFYEVIGKNENIEYTLTNALVHEKPKGMKGEIHASLTVFKGDYMLSVINTENGVVKRSYSVILTDKPIMFKPKGKDTKVEITGKAGAEDLTKHFFYHAYKIGEVRNREPEF